jgi:hypothetical protein
MRCNAGRRRRARSRRAPCRGGEFAGSATPRCTSRVPTRQLNFPARKTRESKPLERGFVASDRLPPGLQIRIDLEGLSRCTSTSWRCTCHESIPVRRSFITAGHIPARLSLARVAVLPVLIVEADEATTPTPLDPTGQVPCPEILARSGTVAQ